MKTKTLATILALTVVASAPAAAQVTVNASASITVPAVLYMDVTNTAVTFAVPAGADYDNGYIAQNSGASVISHRGNVRHDVRIWTDVANMTGSGGAFASDPVSSTKPVTDLLWSTDNFASVSHPLTQAATAAAATGADQVIVSQAARGTYDNAETINFRMSLSYANDTPGTYSVNFFYTAIAN
jgi:hypothetical protein